MTTTPAGVSVPPLRDGDRLTREEFHRRYLAMPHVKKAELINGVVHMPSPVSLRHGEPHLHVSLWLGNYMVSTPGVRGFSDTTVILKGDNEVQPDAFLIVDPARGGRAAIDPDGYLTGGPELAVEVAVSSVSKDRNEKFRLYRDNGVCEYVLWRVEAGAIDWFSLREGRYDPLPPTGGVYRSEALPGLWLDAAAMLRGDLAAVMAALQQGLSSPEHAAFGVRLRSAEA